MPQYRYMVSDSEETRERSPRAYPASASQIPNWKQYKCFAIGVAYSGERYQGFQIQAGDTPTVERDIQTALIAARLIAPGMIEEKGRMNLFWSRSARTDRGVHACMNVVSCRMNASLIETREGSGPLQLDQEAFVTLLNSHLPPSIRCMFINRVTMRFDARIHCDRRRYDYYLPAKFGKYIVDEDKLRTEMQRFVGTHNFHNFTKGVSAEDKSATRHIVSIAVVRMSDEFLRVTLMGQSFLLNQIRKMVGLAVEVSVGLAPSDAIDTALTSGKLVHIHMVPGEGLLLDRLYFRGYDLHKCGDYNVTTPFSWIIQDEESDGDASVMDRMESFKKELIEASVLPKLPTLFDDWIVITVGANPWNERQDPRRHEH